MGMAMMRLLIPDGGLAFQTMSVYGRAEAANAGGIKYTLEGESEVSINTRTDSVWYEIPGPGTLAKTTLDSSR